MRSDLNTYHYPLKVQHCLERVTPMSIDLSKLCADFLRQNYSNRLAKKLKASHARELVAAFFGYKCHAALLADKDYPLSAFEEVAFFAPDVGLMDERRKHLTDLPETLLPSYDIAQSLAEQLVKENIFRGDLWLYSDLGSYISEVLLIDADGSVMDELSGVMAETNAEFTDFPSYGAATITDFGDSIEVVVKGRYEGDQLDGKLFSGDTIDFTVTVLLSRVSGKRGFSDFEVSAGGEVNDDWVDPEVKYDIPNTRPKEQFMQMTGGFQFGETQEQFKNRQAEIHALRNRIAEREHSAADIERLSDLLISDTSEEFDNLL